MNDPNANTDRPRPRAAADLHRRRVMDPADAAVNHTLDLACGGDLGKARAALREASRRDPGFAERYERTARVLALLKDGEERGGGNGCPDLASRIIDRVEQQRLFLPRPRTLSRGRSAIASAALALMAVLGVMQFRTNTTGVDGAALQASIDGVPPIVQAGALAASQLKDLLAQAACTAASRNESDDWSLPMHATARDGLSRRESALPFNSPTARRPGDQLEAFTSVASWRVAPLRRDALPTGLMGLAESHEAIEANLRRAMDR
ncbi:MAG: hypothetical protein WCK33_05985 [Phycisphaerae bacterium]